MVLTPLSTLLRGNIFMADHYNALIYNQPWVHRLADITVGLSGKGLQQRSEPGFAFPTIRLTPTESVASVLQSRIERVRHV